MSESISNVNGQNSTGCTTGGTKSTSEQTEAQKADAGLRAIFLKYDTNHNNKIGRKERKKAGLTKEQAKALNKASQAFNNKTPEITVKKMGSSLFCYYDKDGKEFLSTVRDGSMSFHSTEYDDNNVMFRKSVHFTKDGKKYSEMTSHPDTKTTRIIYYDDDGNEISNYECYKYFDI